MHSSPALPMSAVCVGDSQSDQSVSVLLTLSSPISLFLPQLQFCSVHPKTAINNSDIIILIFPAHYGNNKDDNYNSRDWNTTTTTTTPAPAQTHIRTQSRKTEKKHLLDHFPLWVRGSCRSATLQIDKLLKGLKWVSHCCTPWHAPGTETSDKKRHKCQISPIKSNLAAGGKWSECSEWVSQWVTECTVTCSKHYAINWKVSEKSTQLWKKRKKSGKIATDWLIDEPTTRRCEETDTLPPWQPEPEKQKNIDKKIDQHSLTHRGKKKARRKTPAPDTKLTYTNKNRVTFVDCKKYWWKSWFVGW